MLPPFYSLSRRGRRRCQLSVEISQLQSNAPINRVCLVERRCRLSRREVLFCHPAFIISPTAGQSTSRRLVRPKKRRVAITKYNISPAVPDRRPRTPLPLCVKKNFELLACEQKISNFYLKSEDWKICQPLEKRGNAKITMIDFLKNHRR